MFDVTVRVTSMLYKLPRDCLPDDRGQVREKGKTESPANFRSIGPKMRVRKEFAFLPRGSTLFTKLGGATKTGRRITRKKSVFLWDANLRTLQDPSRRGTRRKKGESTRWEDFLSRN